MVKKLDFNALEQPVLEITLRDEAHTVVRITTPQEAQVERFMAMAENVKSLSKENNGEVIKASFEVIAECINNNLDELTVTADSLRTQYNLKLYDAVIFVKVYLEFLKEIENAKN